MCLYAGVSTDTGNFAFNNTKFNVELAFEKLKNMKHRIEDVQKAVNLLAH